MLEITSDFRIRLDLLELANFGMNHGLQTVDKATKGCTKVALQYFSPFPAKRSFEMIDTVVFFSENLTLQNASGAKVQRIENRRNWWPLCCGSEAKLIHSCLTRAECDGAESCWNVHGLRPRCLSAHAFNTVFKTFSQ